MQFLWKKPISNDSLFLFQMHELLSQKYFHKKKKKKSENTLFSLLPNL